MESARWDIVVVGGAMREYHAFGPALPVAGQRLEADRVLVTPGGTGFTLAVACSRLGARAALVTRVGRDEPGSELIACLAREGVDTRFVVSDPEAPTGALVAMTDRAGATQRLDAPGALRRLSAVDLDAARPAIASARLALFTLEVSPEAVAAAARQAIEAGCAVMVELTPTAKVPPALWPTITILVADARASAALTHVFPRDRDTARIVAQTCFEHGVRAAAIGTERAGRLLAWAEGEAWWPRPPEDQTNRAQTDAVFSAALAVWLAEGRPVAEAGSAAAAAEALVRTENPGTYASLPRRDDVLAQLARDRAQPRRLAG